MPGTAAAAQLAVCCCLLERGLVWAADCWLDMSAASHVALSPSLPALLRNPTHTAGHRC